MPGLAKWFVRRLLPCLPLWLAWAARPCAAAEASGPAPERAFMDRLAFGLDRLPWLQTPVLGNPLHRYLAFLIFIVLSFYAAKLLDWIVLTQLRHWARQTRTRFDDILLELLHGPIKVITFVILLHIGLHVFEWPDWAADFVSNGLKIVVACSLTYLALKLVDLSMSVWQRRIEAAQQEAVLDLHLLPMLRKTFKIVVVIVAVLVTSQNLGMNATGLLASLSIGGLAVGLAAQDMLANLFGAVAIFADKPFRIGDRIQLDSIDGTVEAIGLRSTRVRNLNGHLVAIPNKTMASASIINVSKRPNIKTVMNLGITLATPAHRVERAMAIIREVYGRHPKTVDLVVGFDKFEASAMNLLVIHWWDSTNFKEYIEGFQHLNLELKRRLDAEDIRLAMPSQTIYLRQDSQWKLAGENGELAAPAADPAGLSRP